MNSTSTPFSPSKIVLENLSNRWRGVLQPGLKKLLEQISPEALLSTNALDYVETLCLYLLNILCRCDEHSSPSGTLHSIEEAEDRVRTLFPEGCRIWVLKEAREASERGKKKCCLPVDKICTLLIKEATINPTANTWSKLENGAATFIVGVLECVALDILRLSNNYTSTIGRSQIDLQDVRVAMHVDEALMELFFGWKEDQTTNFPHQPPTSPVLTSTPNLRYEDVVRELLSIEKSYLQDLHMLLRVFREEISKLAPKEETFQTIFLDLSDVYDLTVNLIGNFEDALEIAQRKIPYVGSCFEEFAEGAEFDVYAEYAQSVVWLLNEKKLEALLLRPDVKDVLVSVGHGMELALKYYFPALLVNPLRHCFSYFETVKSLTSLSESEDDKESLTQVEGLLVPLQAKLQHLYNTLNLKPDSTQYGERYRRYQALEKLSQLKKLAENWERLDYIEGCNEFIREGTLSKVGFNKKLSERRVYLFDGLVVFYKPNSRRIKERFSIKAVRIVDYCNENDLKYSFEILPFDRSGITLCCKSDEEKKCWLADLVMLNTRPMLNRILDSITVNIERKRPLRLPTVEQYKFAEEDSPENILLELKEEEEGIPVIKGATLLKLVERLTYHVYADPKFVRIFLTTYRSFCSSSELLALLIERFNIPEANDVFQKETFSDELQGLSQLEECKRYVKEYSRPIQFRVLNALRYWIDHHIYDFERHPQLFETLEEFLESAKKTRMRKWVETVLKILQRKKSPSEAQKTIKFDFDTSPPSIAWHQIVTIQNFNIITLHPVEIARQLTLLDFELYKSIKPSELVGAVWTKNGKEITSPNLLKMIKHTTAVTRWLQKTLVETSNYEERVAVFQRITEIIVVMQDLNNFNGVLAFVSALNSAAIYRLKFTFSSLSQSQKKMLDEWMDEDYLKRYQERLRSINPPCVPFVGMYLTNILHVEEGNPDFLSDSKLINFFKQRKVANITGEIEQYQNQPYCYNVEPKIRSFLECLNPFREFSDPSDIDNYLYNKSLEIEPRGCRNVPKFSRRWPSLNLRSPGIKTKSSRNSTMNWKFDNGEDSSSPLLSPGSATPTTPLFSGLFGSQGGLFLATPSPNVSTKSFLRPGSCVNVSMDDGANSSEPASPTSPMNLNLEEGGVKHSLPPPPLPPRRRTTIQNSSAPTLPPRIFKQPPPLPPRRDRISFTSKRPISCGLPTNSEIFLGDGIAPKLHPTYTSQLHIRRHSRCATPSTSAEDKPPPLPPKNLDLTFR